MKYQIGDKIVVKITDEEGTVVDILNEKMVMIDVRGVKYPAYMDQIDFPYFKMFTEKLRKESKKKIYVDNVKQEKPKKKTKTQDGVFLSILPVFSKDVFDDDMVDYLKIFLINHNEEAYTFDYNLFFGNEESAFSLKATVEGLSEIYLHDIDYDDVSDNPRFDFVFELKKPEKNKAEYYERSVKLNGKKIFKRIEELIQNHEASFQQEVFLHYPAGEPKSTKLDLSKLTGVAKVIDAKKAKDYLAPARSVVDLHIEKLVDEPGRLSNAEILDIQLREFEKYYDLALAHHLKKFTVIHGIGEGKLRDEIHEALKLKRDVASFHNISHPQFGNGATEVFFK